MERDQENPCTGIVPGTSRLKTALQLAPVQLDVASVFMTFMCNVSPQVKICATVILAKTHTEICRISQSRDLLYSSEKSRLSLLSHLPDHRSEGMAEMSDTHLGLPVTTSNTAGEQ